MQTLNQLEETPLPIEDEEKRHTRRLLLGVLCALLLTGLLFGGYLVIRKRHERDVAAAAAAEAATKKNPPPRIEIAVDEATLNGKKTVLGGELHNISGEPLSGLAVELELKRRGGGTNLETRAINPEQSELGPDARTRYGVELLAQDYINARLLRIVAGPNKEAVPFKVLPGAPRPPMPAPAAKTVIVSRPAPKGDEFINTPNNPGRVP